MLSAVVLHFHARPEAGPGIDQLKFSRLADGPSSKSDQSKKAITGAAVINGRRICAQVERVSARPKEWRRIGYGHELEEKGGLKDQKDDHHQVTKHHDLRYVLDQEGPME